MLIGGMMAVANGAFLPSDNIPWKAYKKCGVRPNVQTIDEPTFGRRKREFDWLEYGNDLNGKEHIDLLSREKRDKMRADTRVSYINQGSTHRLVRLSGLKISQKPKSDV